MSQLLIESKTIAKSFNEQFVLEDINFSVKEGEIVGLLGPNGSGKTTIVRLLNGVINPDRGQMKVAGLDPVKNGNPIRQMSGILTEGAGLYHELSGLENLEFFSKLYGVMNDLRIHELLAQFGLEEHQNKKVGTYSTGMKKRLSLIKALLHQPKILFLDEPTNGLDPEGILLVMDYIKQLNKEHGTTILLCSHVLQQIETVCHRYIFLDKGKIIESGSQKELEDKYLKEVKLQVETGLQFTGNVFEGFPIERISEEIILLTLPSKNEISKVLQKILAHSWVHLAVIQNRDLESLYFSVRSASCE